MEKLIVGILFYFYKKKVKTESEVRWFIPAKQWMSKAQVSRSVYCAPSISQRTNLRGCKDGERVGEIFTFRFSSYFLAEITFLFGQWEKKRGKMKLYSEKKERNKESKLSTDNGD